MEKFFFILEVFFIILPYNKYLDHYILWFTYNKQYFWSIKLLSIFWNNKGETKFNYVKSDLRFWKGFGWAEPLYLYGFLKEETIIKCHFKASPPLLLFCSYLFFSLPLHEIKRGGGLRSTMLYDAIYEKTFAYLFSLSPKVLVLVEREKEREAECVWIIDVVLQDHLIEIFLLGAVRIFS